MYSKLQEATLKQEKLFLLKIAFCVQKLKFHHIDNVKDEWGFALYNVFDMMYVRASGFSLV